MNNENKSKLLENIIGWSFIVAMLSAILSVYQDPSTAQLQKTTPTRGLGALVLGLVGVSEWGHIFTFLIKPSLWIFGVSLTLYLIMYPKIALNHVRDYISGVKERLSTKD